MLVLYTTFMHWQEFSHKCFSHLTVQVEGGVKEQKVKIEGLGVKYQADIFLMSLSLLPAFSLLHVL